MNRSFLYLVLSLSLFISCTGEREEESPERRVVDQNGQLSIKGTRIINEFGDTLVLEGMSMFWSQWIDKYYNYKAVKWLRDDWHCEIIRLALGVQPNGYLEHSRREERKIIRMIDACIDLGIYVIVDWHSHSAENNTAEAAHFFADIARKYGNYPNVIYEIYNEPQKVSWSDVVKPYLDIVIDSIRRYDPDNIIIAGTPQWSQNVDEASEDPLSDRQVAYTLHFYAATHKDWLRVKALKAIENGLTLWVTEFGTCVSDGNGKIDHEELALWFEFMEAHQLSWCNWSLADKDETSAVLKPGSRTRGGWKEEDLTESGRIIRTKLRSVNP
jgi:endoglucanase